MGHHRFQPSLTPLDDRIVPTITPTDVFAAIDQSEKAREMLSGLLQHEGDFNIFTVAYLKNFLPTLTDQSVKSSKVLAEFQQDVQGQSDIDPALSPLIGLAAGERYKSEVNALYAAALTKKVGGIPLGSVQAPLPPSTPTQQVAGTYAAFRLVRFVPPVVIPPTSDLPLIDKTTNAGLTATIPDITSASFIAQPSGLKIANVVVGEGDAAKAGQDVNVFYTGYLLNGTSFDGNRTGSPTTFNLNGVIAGFREGIIGMKPGGIRQLFIPANLGYGAAGSGTSIPPNSDLVFEVKLLSATDPAPRA